MKKPRVRRSPEEATALILASAEQVLAERGPDAVGLKEVARHAGVSHALVTHYFGTYEALVHAVLKRRMDLAREHAEQLLMTAPSGPDFLLSLLFSLLSDPLHVRLTTWALLSARRSPLLGLEAGLLTPLLELMAARRAQLYGKKAADPELIAMDTTLALAAGYGFALGKDIFAHAMGREPFTLAQFQERLTKLLKLQLIPKG